MKCMDCKGEMINDFTSYVVDLKKCLIIVKNVPCIKCEQCGEAYFTDDVAARLDEIVKSVSGLMTEIAIIDYSDKAA